jgi:hypothetical protein
MDFSSRRPPLIDASGVVGAGAPSIERWLGVLVMDFFSIGFGGGARPFVEATMAAAGANTADLATGIAFGDRSKSMAPLREDRRTWVSE